MSPGTQAVLGLALAGVLSGHAADGPRIAGLDRNGKLSWTNVITPGVCTVEYAADMSGPWQPWRNVFCANANGYTVPGLSGSLGAYRLRMVDVSNTAPGFTNLVNSYGVLETIIGAGVGQTDNVNYWQSWYEGMNAKWVGLSRPHFAQADRAGNVFVADKHSHSILRMDRDGLIHTHAGTHEGGFNGDGPAPATSLHLDQPNGEWVRDDGVVYVLDTNNGRVRRVDTNGVMHTLFLATPDGSSLSGGRGLWVNATESLAYFCAGTKLRKWTPGGGLATVASGFNDLGNLYVESAGTILLTDRGDHVVFRVTPSGAATIIAGNGSKTGGGDGFPALQSSLYGVRGVWPVPTGGLLMLTHEGSQLWYMNSSGILRLLLNGASGRTHSGDGAFFYAPWPSMSEGRSVTLDYEGNILITESDWGYVRRIRFLPMP